MADPASAVGNRKIDNTGLVRGLKYTFLFFALAVVIFFIFTIFSSYVDRRNFDAAIREGANNSLTYEYMYYAFDGARDQLDNLLDARCAERDALAYYRLSTYHLRNAYSRIYQMTLASRGAIRQFIRAHTKVLDVGQTEAKLDVAWGVLLASDLVFQPSVSEAQKADTSAEFNNLQIEEAKRFDVQISKDADLTRVREQINVDLSFDVSDPFKKLNKIYDNVANKFGSDKAVFDLTAVNALENQLKALNASSLQPYWSRDDLVARTFIQRLILDKVALNGLDVQGAAQLASKVINPARGTTQGNLEDLDCSRTYRPLIDAVSGFFDKNVSDGLIKGLIAKFDLKGEDADSKIKAIIVDSWPKSGSKISAQGVLGETPKSASIVTSAASTPGLLYFFLRQSTTAQTLLVTVLFGIAGALCLNCLRLSQRGAWSTIADPSTGEIALSIVLGGCAALIVFLLATLGLIVVSDGQSNAGNFSTVGASLLGVLGFISGLLNDSAFGRIRAVGRQFFGQEAEAGAEDDDFVRLLKQLGCSCFARLAKIHSLSKQYGTAEFTLFVPFDGFFEGLTLAQWDKLAEPDDDRFFKAMVERLTFEKKLTFADIQEMKTPMIMRDKTALAVDATHPPAVTLDGVKLRSSSAEWKGASIFVLEGVPNSVLSLLQRGG